jgi:hypothetical protein
MIIRRLIGVLMIFTPILCACDDKTGDVGNLGDDDGALQDLNQYRDQLEQLLERPLIGTIKDTGRHEIPCEYDGESFEIALQLDDDMVCHDEEGEWTSCDNAASGYEGITGLMTITPDTEIAMRGTAYLFGMGAIFSADIELVYDERAYDSEEFGHGAFESMDFDSEITEIHWSRYHGADPETGDPMWEGCLMEMSN